MLDVIVAGAGPAGSIAALVLARAGARVLIIDRETFPRDKLCGDTLNPGALRLLASMDLGGGPIDRGVALNGILVSGPTARVRTLYGPGIAGRAVRRTDLDGWLLERAIAAGAKFESGLIARGPLTDSDARPRIVRGLVLAQKVHSDRLSRIPSALVIAADGARSVIARSVGLSTTPAWPRRWAFGAYASGVEGVTDVGEMHVRQGIYVGVAPMGRDIVNVCVVTGPRPRGRQPLDVIMRTIDADSSLGRRFRSAKFLSTPRVLGPLAADVSSAGVPGLLLAGDAAGFIDPMTGDGLHLAMRGAMLAATEALRSLETSDLAGAPARLAEAREEALGAKLRFNRAARAVTSSPVAVSLASLGAAVAPVLMRKVVRYAGDVPRA